MGLDQYEVRKWDVLHITLAMLQAFLSVGNRPRPSKKGAARK